MMGKKLCALRINRIEMRYDDDKEFGKVVQVSVHNDKIKQEIMKKQSAHDYVYCPEYGTRVIHESGCVTCPSCGWGLCG